MIKTNKMLVSVISLCLLIGSICLLDVDYSFAATKKIHVKKSSISIIAGKTYQQKMINKKGKTIKATLVKWKSLKTSVAKINKKGKVTAVKAGKAKMTAKYKGKTYKFTVTVKKPFASGTRPTITKVKPNKNGTIYVDYSDVKNAVEYQLFVSVDDGEYKLYEQDAFSWNDYEGAEEGKKYSFKARAVAGKHYTSFSKEKDCVYYSSNSLIELEKTELLIEQNESVDLTVHTDRGFAISKTVSNGNVTCSFNDNWREGINTRILHIYGSKAGESTITISDNNNPNIKAVIHVTVYPKHNTSISVDKKEVALNVGKTESVIITTDGGYNIGGSVESDSGSAPVSCSIGTMNTTTKTCTLTLRGLREGDAVITIYDQYDKSISTTIKVSVRTAISVEESSVTLQSPEEMKTVNIKLDKERTLNTSVSGSKYNYDTGSMQSIVKCSFGEWDESTKTIKLFIRGNYPGSGTIYISDENDTSVKTSIEVNVEWGVTITYPELPAIYSYYNKDNTLRSSIKIKEIQFNFFSYINGKVHILTHNASGVVTFSQNSDQTVDCRVEFELISSDGKVAASGTLSGGGVVGEVITLYYSYDSYLKPGEYELKLSDSYSK